MRKKYYDDAKENAAFERCVGVLIILATIGVVYYLFRKYGRR